jgi:VWFA-related protein
MVQSLSLVVVTFCCTLTLTAVQAQTSADACVNKTRKHLPLTALDKKTLAVLDLQKQDLVLRRNDSIVPIEDIAVADAEPIDVAIVIDNSASQNLAIDAAKSAAEKLVQAIARPGKDRIAVVSLSNEPSYEQLLTLDIDLAIKAIKELDVATMDVLTDARPRHIPNAIVDLENDRMTRGASAIWESTKDVLRLFSSSSANRRRALVLFTNGDDTVGKTTRSELMEAAIKDGVVIYSVGVAGLGFHIEEASLEELSATTGGVAGFPKANKDYGRVLTELARRLRAGYSITYCTGASETPRQSLKLTVSNHQNAKAAYPRIEN